MALGSSDHAGGLHQQRRLRDLLKGGEKVGLKMQRCAACCLLGILKGLLQLGKAVSWTPPSPPPGEGRPHLVLLSIKIDSVPCLCSAFSFIKNRGGKNNKKGPKKEKKKKGIFNILTMTALKFSLFSRKDKKSSKHWLFHQK